jgi:hypothetical protein
MFDRCRVLEDEINVVKTWLEETWLEESLYIFRRKKLNHICCHFSPYLVLLFNRYPPRVRNFPWWCTIARLDMFIVSVVICECKESERNVEGDDVARQVGGNDWYIFI